MFALYLNYPNAYRKIEIEIEIENRKSLTEPNQIESQLNIY